MSCKPWLTDEQRAARKRASILRVMAEYRGTYGGVGKGSRERAELLDEGEEIMPLVQAGCNRITTNLGEGSSWKRPRKGMA